MSEKDMVPQPFLFLKPYYSFHLVLWVVVGISARQVTVVDLVLRLALRDDESSENILALSQVNLSDGYFDCVDHLSHKTPKLCVVKVLCGHVPPTDFTTGFDAGSM